MNNPSACLRIRTSLTSAGKRNSCGSRTAWLAPFRNIDALFATALDTDLTAAFDVRDLPFPGRARFISRPSERTLFSICLAADSKIYFTWRLGNGGTAGHRKVELNT